MRPPSYRFAALQSQGERDYQEDDFGILDDRSSASKDGEHTLLVVADGMGGHAAGSRASQIATETFIDSYEKCEGGIPRRLLEALKRANAGLATAIDQDESLEGMGTTIVAAVVAEDQLYWISIGDSPMWIYRKGSLQRVNEDHSMMPVLAEMVEAGRITKNEMMMDPKRNALRSALMGDEIGLVDASQRPISLLSEDVLLLSSDGLMTLSEEQIVQVIAEGEGIINEEIPAKLMDAVNKVNKSSQDNTTVLIYSIELNQKEDEILPDEGRQPLKK